jgi:pimeloyl-ACP methyl ester carboxylesterase
MSSALVPAAMPFVISLRWRQTPIALKPDTSTGLVGSWPGGALHLQRAISLATRRTIRCPVLFFQGLQDKVVPAEQTEQDGRRPTPQRNHSGRAPL